MSLDYNTLRITESMLARDCENLLVDVIDIHHISEHQVSDRQIDNAKLIYYVLPLEAQGMYVAKILKNIYGDIGFVTQSGLDLEIWKTQRLRPKELIAERQRQVMAQNQDTSTINLFPQQPQRQDSLRDQLKDLIDLANRAGLYDAADWVEAKLKSM